MRQLACAAFIAAGLTSGPAAAEEVSNPVTGYQVSLFRDGGSHDFQGWIRLFNGTADAGYVYIHNGTQMMPRLGSTKYVVLDIPVDMLGATLDMLNSGKPVFITYNDFGDPNDSSGFLHVGGDQLPGIGAAEEIATRTNKPARAFTAAQ